MLEKVSPASAFLSVFSWVNPASAFWHQAQFRYRWSLISLALPSYAFHTLQPAESVITLFILISFAMSFSPQITYFSYSWNRVSVSAYSAGAYTATLLVMVNVMKGGGRAPPTLTSIG